MGYKEFCESVEHNVAKEQLIRILYVWRGLSSKGVFIIGLEKCAFISSQNYDIG